MRLLEDLNPQQRQAVTASQGQALVLAGPGSGKTRVLTHRIGFLVAQLGVSPSKIMAVTFTNKAAREMRGRVEALLGNSLSPSSTPEKISLGTFHAFAAGMIRREASRLPITREYVIFDESDQKSLLRQVLKDLNIDPKQNPPSRLHNAISAAKNELIEPADYAAENYFGELVRRAYQSYQKRLLENNALDFDDLLMWAVKLLQDHEDLRAAYRRRYPHILVDEFQDTNTSQYVLLRLLAGSGPDLFVVGDPDQSIYRWRGADYRNIRRFQEDYPRAQVFLLEQNYRSTQRILDGAMAVIDKHPGRQRKQLFTDRGPGAEILIHEAYDDADEANFVTETLATLVHFNDFEPGDCAVMYRTNAQSRALEEAFLKAGLPYRLVGAQRFYGRREVKDLVAYLRLIHNPEDQVSLFRVLNTPPRGIGAKTVEALLKVAEAVDDSPSQVLLDLAEARGSRLAEKFSRRAASVLTQFGAMLAGLRAAQPRLDLVSIIDRVIDESDYRSYIDDGTEEGSDRWANVLELRAVAEEFKEVGLTTFLEHVALISDQDTLTEAQNAPTLLTLHAAKGLEFPVVIIVGLDEGILPHQRSFEDPEAMAEERRLFYVGITRAMDRLILARTFRRRIFGRSELPEPSRYLADLPPEIVRGDLVTFQRQKESAYQQQTRWDSSQLVEKEPVFHVGMRVQHTKFGEGIVMDSRVQQDDEEVTVAFEEVGIKRLAASIAKLELLE